MIARHLKSCRELFFSPGKFFEKKSKEDWSEDPFGFLGINVLIFAFFATLLVFVNQYLPMGALLVEGIDGAKFIFILPVIIVLAFSFFALTFLVAAGCILVATVAIFYATGAIMDFLLKSSGESYFDMIKDSFYSSAVILFALIPVIILYFVKRGLFTFSHFMLGYYIVYGLLLLFLYGLLNSAASRLYPSAKAKIWIVATIPIFMFAITGVVFGLKVLPKVAVLIV
ncbi:MAG: hypothetical protein HQ564_07915 [Candidatus Saganbacteria bacterium]|nr:hypothetical protein [Candidatus Saganbacteria bacterium]